MEIVEEGDEALGRIEAEESAFRRWLYADHALRVLMRHYAQFNLIDAYVLSHLPEEHRPIAALLLTHHTDEQIIARLAVDQATIEQVRLILLILMDTSHSIVPELQLHQQGDDVLRPRQEDEESAFWTQLRTAMVRRRQIDDALAGETRHRAAPASGRGNDATGVSSSR